MKGFEKFILIVFSIIMIILSVFLILVSTEMIFAGPILKIAQNWLIANKTVGVVVGAIFALLGLVGMFSSSENAEEMRGGLAIKSDTGTVYITRDTFESIIIGVLRSYAELRNVKVDTTLNDAGVVANVYAMILPDTVVPSLTAKVQEDIKTSVLKQTTVEIKEVNVKIRGVYIEPQKK
ncbi:MAG: alkaline shock response membrane anchor protein AmaP [Clostridia bacterium]